MSIIVKLKHSHPGMIQGLAVFSGSSQPLVLEGGQEGERVVSLSQSAIVVETNGGETADQAKERALKRMWAGYCQQGGGKTFDGKPLPTWEELGEERQACWRAALAAI